MQTKLVLSALSTIALLTACAQPAVNVASANPCLGIAPPTGSMIARKEYCQRMRAEALAERGQAGVVSAQAADNQRTKLQ